MIQRQIYKELFDWKKSSNRKPLILRWARQVGKSFIVEEFWKKEFWKIHKINFQSNKKAHLLFEDDLDAKKIIQKIEYLLGDDINIEKDLLFFDEIQECSKAINSLKFFNEELKNLAIINAWSYLWLMKNEESFPVWKVDYLSMFPLNFEEFLLATNKRLFEFYDSINIDSLKVINEIIHKDLLEMLNLYFAIWWMPEIVQTYIRKSQEESNINTLKTVRILQNNLLESYKADFAKHWKFVNSSHILSVYESVPYQLSKSFDEEVKKFKFAWVIPGQKWYDRIVWHLTWLSKARLIIKNNILSNIAHPLKAYYTENKFKVFFHDIWLLNASLDTPITSIINQELWHYKWFIAENFVAMELFNIYDSNLLSWSKWESEIEFIVVKNDLIIPIEVKSSIKSKKAKSLDSYINRYSPQIAYKVSLANYWKNPSRGFITLPMYLIWKILKND